MLRKIQNHKKKIDQLFEKVEIITDSSLKAEWAKYLCILVSGFIEDSFKELIYTFIENRTSTEIKAFVVTEIKDITNLNADKIAIGLIKFSKEWKEKFEIEITDEQKEHLKSIISNRHNIAHGKIDKVQLKLSDIIDYYKSAIKVVEILHTIIIR